jgi:hypothetical protein
MKTILNHLTQLLLWLTEVDQPAAPHLTPADWADLPTYHEPAPRS